jgi:hypothetical protein
MTVDNLNSLRPSGLPNHRLRLCVGAKVICLRNLDTAAGLCNGTILKVLHCHAMVSPLLLRLKSGTTTLAMHVGAGIN